MDELDFTVGFELEFEAVYSPEVLTEAFAMLGVHRFEKEGEYLCAGHAVFEMLKMADLDVSGWNWEDLENDDPERPDASLYSSWRIGTDSLSVSEAEDSVAPPGYYSESVEISSRKFRYGEDWESELHTLLQALQIFEHQYKCRLVVNESTGLHVHVGNNDQKIPFATCKRILQLVTAHERNLDAAHTINRIQGHLAKDQTVSPPLFAPPSFFLHANDSAPRPNIFSRLFLIEQTSSFRSMGQYFRANWLGGTLNGHYSAYNFDNNFPDDDPAIAAQIPVTGTVEFRQHTGTRDPAAIAAWIQVCVHLTHYCHTMDDSGFLQLLLAATNIHYSLRHLLTTLALPRDVCNFYLLRDPDATALDDDADDADADPDGLPISAFAALTLTPRPHFRPVPPPIAADLDFSEAAVCLRNLDAVNAGEQAANRDWEGLKAVIARKWRAGAYGLDAEAAGKGWSGLWWTRAEAREKLAWAREEVRGALYCYTEEQRKQLARMQVFMDLHRTYNEEVDDFHAVMEID